MYSKQKSSYNKVYKYTNNNRPKSAMIRSDKVKIGKVKTVDSAKRETKSYFAYLDVDSDLEEGEERDEIEEVQEIDEESDISEISEMSEVDDEISTNNNLAKPETRSERGLRMSKMKHWADYSDDEE